MEKRISPGLAGNHSDRIERREACRRRQNEGWHGHRFSALIFEPEERVAREAFYRKMVWVVDGRRRKRDVVQLLKCIGPCAWGQPPFILHVASHEECALLRDWQSSTVPVYFDLGLCEHNGVSAFWRLDPVSRIGRMYLTPVSKESFLRVDHDGLDAEQKFSEGVSVIVEALQRTAQRPEPVQDFRLYRSRRYVRRRL